MPTRSPLSQPVVMVVAIALVFANGIINALPNQENLSDAQKLLFSGAVAVVSWLLTLGVENLLAKRSPGTTTQDASTKPAGTTTPRVMLWAGVAFVPAGVIGAYWVGTKALATLWDLFGAQPPITNRGLIVAVSLLFVVAHTIAAAAMVSTRDLATSWCSTGMARTGASIATIGHLAACVLWASSVARLAMPILVFTIAYAAIMLIVVTGRLVALGSSRPVGVSDWLTVVCFGLITPVFQMLEVVSWAMFAAWIRRRQGAGAGRGEPAPALTPGVS